MATKQYAVEIVEALRALPAEKVLEVRDFVFFLKERYGNQEKIDESYEWLEEDIRDFSVAVAKYAEETIPWQQPDQGKHQP